MWKLMFDPIIRFIMFLAPFSFSFGFAQIPIRWLADGSPRLRLYWNGGPHVHFNEPHEPGKVSRIHLHHFIWAIPISLISWALFAINQDFAALLLAGFASALWFSEGKELITQKWGK
jgi:hypothetical protein